MEMSARLGGGANTPMPSGVKESRGSAERRIQLLLTFVYFLPIKNLKLVLVRVEPLAQRISLTLFLCYLLLLLFVDVSTMNNKYVFHILHLVTFVSLRFQFAAFI